VGAPFGGKSSHFTRWRRLRGGQGHEGGPWAVGGWRWAVGGGRWREMGTTKYTKGRDWGVVLGALLALRSLWRSMGAWLCELLV